MKVQDLYSQVTATIIKQLEEGTPPWTRPWRDGKIKGIGMIPSNLITGRLYSGSNVLLLWLTALERGYDSLQFCTFKQVNDIGAKVRKGEKATNIIFTKHLTREDEEGNEKASTIAKAYSVFHVSQIDGLPEKYQWPQELPQSDTVTYGQAAELVARNRVKVKYGGNRAAYYPSADEIVMPFANQFESEDAFWQVMFHETCHWSGHKDRLNRTMGKRFADSAYAMEELVAELGSAYLCARAGIPAGFRSASYIETWLKVLKADSRAIFSASSYAGHATDYLWGNAFLEVKAAAE